MATTTGDRQRSPEPAGDPLGLRIVAADDVATLPRHELADGAAYAPLWSQGRSVAGILWLEPGTHLDEHTHRRHAHHVWVVAGALETVGRELAAGAYAYVPPGLAHAMTAGDDGATFFYLYLEVPSGSSPPD